MLQSVQDQLMVAGSGEDMVAAAKIVELAITANVRPVDILLGIITPLLYNIGEEFERGCVTLADEASFTTFCENVFELLKEKVEDALLLDSDLKAPRILMMNAPGNTHTLAIRILTLWLRSQGFEAILLNPAPPVEDLLMMDIGKRRLAILISLALPEQRQGVVRLVEQLICLPEPKPLIVVGGYAVKLNLVAPIPDCIFLESITGLAELLDTAKTPAPIQD
jgi:methanogenic corrinoid protein MtbC1